MKTLPKLLVFSLLILTAISLSACSKTNTAQTQNTSTTTPYTLDQVKAHATKSDCWTAIDGQVYDLTSFIASGQHQPIIANACGVDSSSMFKNVSKHSGSKAQNLLPTMVIGYLAQ